MFKKTLLSYCADEICQCMGTGKKVEDKNRGRKFSSWRAKIFLRSFSQKLVVYIERGSLVVTLSVGWVG